MKQISGAFFSPSQKYYVELLFTMGALGYRVLSAQAGMLIVSCRNHFSISQDKISNKKTSFLSESQCGPSQFYDFLVCCV